MFWSISAIYANTNWHRATCCTEEHTYRLMWSFCQSWSVVEFIIAMPCAVFCLTVKRVNKLIRAKSKWVWNELAAHEAASSKSNLHRAVEEFLRRAMPLWNKISSLQSSQVGYNALRFLISKRVLRDVMIYCIKNQLKYEYSQCITSHFKHHRWRIRSGYCHRKVYQLF